MANQVDFYQIVYKEEQKEACYPFAKIHFNNTLTPFFENSVIRELVLASEADKISVCSWKLREKSKWNVCMPRKLTMEVLESSYDVLSFTCNTKKHQFLNAADMYHKGFKETLKRILGMMLKPMPSEVKYPIYQNHFSAESSIYKRYVIEYLIPAIEIMRDDADCWRNSNYSNLNKRNAADSEYLSKAIGVPYYPMIPFLLERLFAIFCQNERIKVTYL